MSDWADETPTLFETPTHTRRTEQPGLFPTDDGAHTTARRLVDPAHVWADVMRDTTTHEETTER